jgi:hypothetical protein
MNFKITSEQKSHLINFAVNNLLNEHSSTIIKILESLPLIAEEIVSIVKDHEK